MPRIDALRKELESAHGRMPDKAWEYLKQTLGEVSTEEDEVDFMGSAEDFLGFAECFEGSSLPTRERRSKLHSRRGAYSQCARKRVRIVQHVDLCKALAGAEWGDAPGDWAAITRLYNQKYAKEATPQALQRAYWRGKGRDGGSQLLEYFHDLDEGMGVALTDLQLRLMREQNFESADCFRATRTLSVFEAFVETVRKKEDFSLDDKLRLVEGFADRLAATMSKGEWMALSRIVRALRAQDVETHPTDDADAA